MTYREHQRFTTCAAPRIARRIRARHRVAARSRRMDGTLTRKTFAPAAGEGRYGHRAPWWLSLFPVVVAAALASPAEAQVLEGRVVDSQTSEPVATARVSLLDSAGVHLETTLTDRDGRFVFRIRESGPRRLEVERLGYHLHRTESFEADVTELVRREIELVPRAVELEGIVVEGYPGQLLHEGTLEGVWARRARSPSIGSNRVLVRGDPDLDERVYVRDALPGVMRRCRAGSRYGSGPIVYVDGQPAAQRFGPGSGDIVLRFSPGDVLAIEFYRDLNSIPMSIRPLDLPSRVRSCGFLAIWTVWGAPRRSR